LVIDYFNKTGGLPWAALKTGGLFLQYEKFNNQNPPVTELSA
jgi:hypothetical protein